MPNMNPEEQSMNSERNSQSVMSEVHRLDRIGQKARADELYSQIQSKPTELGQGGGGPPSENNPPNDTGDFIISSEADTFSTSTPPQETWANPDTQLIGRALSGEPLQRNEIDQLISLQAEGKIGADVLTRYLGSEISDIGGGAHRDRPNNPTPDREPNPEIDNLSFRQAQQELIRTQRGGWQPDNVVGAQAIDAAREQRIGALETRIVDLAEHAHINALLLHVEEAQEPIERQFALLQGLWNRGQLTERQVTNFVDRATRARVRPSRELPEELLGIDSYIFSSSRDELIEQAQAMLEAPAPVVEVGGGNYRVWEDDQYTHTFQSSEEWGRDRLNKINREGRDRRGWPSYYEHLTEQEQFEIDARRELINAVNFKRSKDANLEVLSNNEAMAGMNKEETQRMYEIPGVKEALTTYLEFAIIDPQIYTRPKPDGTIEHYSFRQSRDNTEINQYRQAVRQSIRQQIIDGYTQRGKLPPVDSPSFDIAVQTYARDAEQVAFNLHYLSNTFESFDSMWVNGRRTRKPEISNELAKGGLQSGMKPLDSLIGSTTTDYKGTESVSRWANTFVREEKARLGIDKIKGYDDVVIVGEKDARDADQYWRVERYNGDKHRIYVPEARPQKLVGSMWEEVKVEEPDGSKRSLLEFIQSGQDIPWNRVPQNLWLDYAGNMNKANKLLQYFQGTKKINFGSDGRDFTWTTEASSALTDRGMANDPKFKRWMLYHSIGVRIDERKPKLFSGRTSARALLVNISKFGTGKELFFSWDPEPFFARGT